MMNDSFGLPRYSSDRIDGPGTPGWTEREYKAMPSRIGGAAFDAATRLGFPRVLTDADIQVIQEVHRALNYKAPSQSASTAEWKPSSSQRKPH